MYVYVYVREIIEKRLFESVEVVLKCVARMSGGSSVVAGVSGALQ